MSDPILRDFPDEFESEITNRKVTGWGGANLEDLGGMLDSLYDEVQESHARIGASGGLEFANSAAMTAILKADLVLAQAHADVTLVRCFRQDDKRTYEWDATSAVAADEENVASDEGGNGRWLAITTGVGQVTASVNSVQAVAAAGDRVTNVAIETDHATTLVIPANTLEADMVIEIEAAVEIVAQNATDTFAVDVHFGAVKVASMGAFDITEAGSMLFLARIAITADGAAGTFNSYGYVDGEDGRETTYLAASAVDTTGTVTVKVSTTNDAANAGNQTDLRILRVKSAV